MIPVRGSLPPPPPLPWYGPKTCVLQHSAWKRGICRVSCTVASWCGLQTCKFAGISATNLPKTCYLQCFGFRKRVVCNLISVYILSLSNFLLKELVFRVQIPLVFSADMLQSYVAWYQLDSSHPTSCVALCWRLDGPDPFPQGPPIPQGGAGYHCSIYILNLSTLSLRYLIWSSFQYLILTYILVTYISIHACLAWNQLSSILSYQLHCCWLEVGWRQPFPGPTHSTGGGGLMGYDHDHGRGGGGGTRNLEHIYILNDYDMWIDT